MSTDTLTKMKDVYIVRHGETNDNRKKRIIQGQADSPLTEDGKNSIREHKQDTTKSYPGGESGDMLKKG
ncbi:MAG: histidine phosphatase family protein [Candidatus Anammoxibacter sp.]